MSEHDLVLDIIGHKNARPLVIDPSRTALLVIDVQRYFVHPGYPFSRVLDSLAPGVTAGYFSRVQSTVLPNIQRNLDFMEDELAKNEWFAGPQFSAADIQMSFPLEAYRARGGLDDRWPRLMGFLQRIHARPGYKRAIERGGEYALVK